MAEKAKKTTKTKKTKTKANPTIKSSVTGRKKAWDKPALGKIVCLIVVVIAILVIIVATMTRGDAPISDDYFVSDGTKYVLSIDAEQDEDNEEKLVTTHIVYYYNGDNITGAKVFYEFADAASAKAAYDDIIKSIAESEEKIDASMYKLNGKYIIVTADEASYKDLKASEIKAQFESYEALQKGEEETEEAEE